MTAKEGRATLEDILAAVEQDATLASDGGGSDATAGAVGEMSASGMGALLSHPELLARLPMLLRAVQSLTEPMHGADRPPRSPEALLCALRPYLGETRRRALDTMIRIARLSESLGTVK
jgi:hypothetical protein